MEERNLEIRRRAYEMWERDGRPSGKNLSYWLAAERSIDEEEKLEAGLEATFPASDPPSSLRR